MWSLLELHIPRLHSFQSSIYSLFLCEQCRVFSFRSIASSRSSTQESLPSRRPCDQAHTSVSANGFRVASAFICQWQFCASGIARLMSFAMPKIGRALVHFSFVIAF